MNIYYLRRMIDKLKNWFRRRTFYVICDPADNSVTLSKALFKHMDVMNSEKAQVYVFSLAPSDRALHEKGEYGFILNPNFEHETQLADVQYNDKYRTIGFESLNPTVNRIFYDYGLPHDKVVKLSVEVCRAGDVQYYKICRPHDKHLG